ncbi:hypothetical protein ACJRO7_020403 [Eucalyptus globulus]|uniref:PGG domain-containing protein n=1 Tax=Eucalyptus globulus TaxID=34317 RepID=A0ABD3KIH0_EUCGL
MKRRLLEAAQKGNINELNDLIKSNGLILEEMAIEGAGNIPLHAACVAGHFDFVRELLKLMPRFTEKVNIDGFSPLHIVAARGDVEIVRELLRKRRIPLHYAVVNGELHVMKLLLFASPESVMERTAREETVLHLAVKNNRFDAVVVLVEHLKQNEKEQVINWKDHKGNTVLHLAAAVKNFEVVDFMLKYEAAEVNTSNESGLTPLDLSTLLQRGAGDREITEILARTGATHRKERSNSPTSISFSADDNDIEGANSHQSDGEPVTNAPQSLSRSTWKNLNKEKESLGDMRNALLIVAMLITSATYQSMLQPPRFSSNVDPNSSKGFLVPPTFVSSHAKDVIYTVVMTANTFGLFVSVQMIVCLTRDLPLKLPLRLCLAAMIQTYICFMPFMPFTSMNKELPLTTVLLLSVLPLIISVLVLALSISFLLLLIQKWLARAMDFYLEGLFRQNLTSNMYSLKHATPRR